MWLISWPAEELLASKEGLCLMVFVKKKKIENVASSEISKRQQNKNYINAEIKKRRNSGSGCYQWVHIFCRLTRLLRENIQHYNRGWLKKMDPISYVICC